MTIIWGILTFIIKYFQTKLNTLEKIEDEHICN